MSDTLSIYINDDDVVGEYSYNNPDGIRSAPYTGYGRTYGDMTGTSVHFDGEIYAAAMWRLWEKWNAAGRTQDDLFDLVIDGMNFTSPGPAFEDMRDGILAATQTSAEACLVSEAFADFGIGEGAQGSVRCRGPFRCTVTITESFAVPSACGGGGGNTAPTVDISSPEDGLSFVEGTSINFVGSASDAEDGDLTASLSWSSSLDVGWSGTGGSVTTTTLSVGTHTITAEVTDSDPLDPQTGSAEITVIVTSTGGGGFTLLATGSKVRGWQHADLSWTGATSANVDIYRDGGLLVTVPNPPSTYHDDVGERGGGSHTYQVFSEIEGWSNEVTVVY